MERVGVITNSLRPATSLNLADFIKRVFRKGADVDRWQEVDSSPPHALSFPHRPRGLPALFRFHSIVAILEPSRKAWAAQSEIPELP
jgi:hypothetical protein